MSIADGVPLKQAQSGSRLILDPQDEHVGYTLRRDTNARDAMARGLAEYLSQVEAMIGGKTARFKKVYATWAQPENEAVYPSAAVVDAEPGQYEERSFTPQILSDTEIVGASKNPDEPYYLQVSAELTQGFTLEVWCSDPEQRSALGLLMEDVLLPVDWMFGFTLELPHYHNARATYTIGATQYIDDEVAAQQRQRRIDITITGQIIVVRALTRRKMKLMGLVNDSLHTILDAVEGTGQGT